MTVCAAAPTALMASELNRITRAASDEAGNEDGGLGNVDLGQQERRIHNQCPSSLSFPYFWVMSSLISSM